ncbi:pyridoxal-phosphate dependent enzyme [Labrenzia sp. 011]|uniref:pyridoxal-phosphate dependent enzyme n=1 Tax=Labrenzia sp. 011 TaxID=2171494 RepID=UPI000D513C8C|nr:pyridoxal-phosphate dependent enzyme [Labrenzia sp. 011]PVB61485.1 PLP-dependent lyase/thiolase [Labrenzia sp. 011]
MDAFNNPWRGRGLPESADLAGGDLSETASEAALFLERSPDRRPSPLLEAAALAAAFGVGALYLKDERNRMGLGSFKALGAAYAIAKRAARKVREGDARDHGTALEGTTFACASAGNHGMSLAAGAPLCGARAVVFVAETVPEAFAVRLRNKGATVVRTGATYEDSMAEAERQAEANGWILLPDSTWPGMTEAGRDVMEGYLIMGDEISRQMPEPPTHVFLQAGVGGLAAACALSARATWGPDVTIVVAEPEYAPALQAGIKAGKAVTAPGPVSVMGRLDCKEPSHLALKYLAREADVFTTITDEEAAETVALLATHDLATTPSGAAGIAALHHAGTEATALSLGPDARVLCYLSEGPEDV